MWNFRVIIKDTINFFITRRPCCMLKPLWNIYCHLESIGMECLFIWSRAIFQISLRNEAICLLDDCFQHCSGLSFQKWESHLHFFNSEGKVTSNIELLKLWKTNLRKMSISSFIVCTDTSISWKAFLLSRLWISAKIVVYVSKINKNVRSL